MAQEKHMIICSRCQQMVTTVYIVADGNVECWNCLTTPRK